MREIQIKSRTKKEIIKITSEINEKETKSIPRINESKNLFFKIIYKVDQHLATITWKKKKKQKKKERQYSNTLEKEERQYSNTLI